MTRRGRSISIARFDISTQRRNIVKKANEEAASLQRIALTVFAVGGAIKEAAQAPLLSPSRRSLILLGI